MSEQHAIGEGDEERIIVLTIGYGGRTLDELIELLRRYEVTHLVDVRTSPYSKYAEEFNRDALERILPQRGLKYVFMGVDLGGRPACQSCYDAEGRVLYDRVKEQEFFRRGIRQLVKGASAPGRKLCLLCSERKPEACHRSKLIGIALTERGAELGHISEEGQLLGQSEIMKRLGNGQYELFGESQHTSRKSYFVRETES
ncbi:MAG: hypothetical protein AKCLJLPJ_02008 [Fimbriimonadales bacterium]|nr:hypothetical protein [Fimbriimonadales bacterium]